MAGVRKRHTVEFKTKVALEAIRQQKTSNQLTAEYGIHATQIYNRPVPNKIIFYNQPITD